MVLSKIKNNQYDIYLFIAIVILLAIGFIMVLSASSFLSSERYETPTYFFLKQIIFGFVAFFCMWFFSRIPYTILASRGVPHFLVLIVIVLLSAVLIWGDVINYSRRWFRFGIIGFQPSELAKLVVIIYFADIFSRKWRQLSNWQKGLLPHAVILLLITGLIYLEPDLGTVVMIMIIVGSMAFLSNIKLKHTIAGLLIFSPFLVYKILNKSGYQASRVESWLSNLNNPLGSGHQIRQSLIGLGRGGITGVGPGGSKQKYLFLPESHTDFVFSILGEEWGFIGTSFVLILFLIILWRGMYIAKNVPDNFGKYLAFGITISMVWYAFINAGVVTMLLPTTGLPMPLLSYGGSSLIIMGISTGILLNISREASKNMLNEHIKKVNKDKNEFQHSVIMAD